MVHTVGAGEVLSVRWVALRRRDIGLVHVAASSRNVTDGSFALVGGDPQFGR